MWRYLVRWSSDLTKVLHHHSLCSYFGSLPSASPSLARCAGEASTLGLPNEVAVYVLRSVKPSWRTAMVALQLLEWDFEF